MRILKITVISILLFSFASCSPSLKEISLDSVTDETNTFIFLKRHDIAIGSVASIKVDGKKVGSLLHGKGMKIAVSPGGHNLELSCFLCLKNDNYNFKITEGETKNFKIDYYQGFFVQSVN